MAVGTRALPPEEESFAAAAVSAPPSLEVGEAPPAGLVVELVLFFVFFDVAFFAFFDVSSAEAERSGAVLRVFFCAADVGVPEEGASLDAPEGGVEDMGAEEPDPGPAAPAGDELDGLGLERVGDPPTRGEAGAAGAEDRVGALGFGVAAGGAAATFGGAVLGALPAPRRKPTTVPGCGS